MQFRKKGKPVWIFLLYVVGLVVYLLLNIDEVQGTKVSFKFQEEGGRSSLILGLVFLAIVLLIFIVAFRRMSGGISLANDLKQAASRIYAVKDQSTFKNRVIVFEEDGFFKNKKLVNAFQAYKEAMEKISKDAPDNKIDISDYINNDMLNQELRSHMLNQIGGTMTGLGILGTFVGLSVGLNAFMLDENSVEIASTVAPLLGGIKVAFHTSIIGLIYSIGYNYFYRSFLADTYSAVETYLQAFENYVVPINEVGVAGNMLMNQRGQLKQQETSTELQKLILKENRAIRYASDEMPAQMADSMANVLNTTVVPELVNVKNALGNFAMSAYENQQDSLKRIVDAFVQEMNTALGNAFSELGEIIHKTNEQQKASMLQMQSIMDQVEATSIRVDKVGTILEDSVQKVSGIADAFNENQQTLISYVKDLNEQTNSYSEILENEKVILEQVKEGELQLQNATKSLVDYVEAGQKTSEEIYQKVNELKLSTENFKTDVSAATEDLRKATLELGEKMDTRTAETFKAFDEQLSVIMSHFSDSIGEVDQTIAKIPRMISGVYGDLEQKMEKIIRADGE